MEGEAPIGATSSLLTCNHSANFHASENMFDQRTAKIPLVVYHLKGHQMVGVGLKPAGEKFCDLAPSTQICQKYGGRFPMPPAIGYAWALQEIPDGHSLESFTHEFSCCGVCIRVLWCNKPRLRRKNSIERASQSCHVQHQSLIWHPSDGKKCRSSSFPPWRDLKLAVITTFNQYIT